MSFWKEQYFDDPFFDEQRQDTQEKFCRYCEAGPLEWKETRGEYNRKKWVLIDERTGEVHDCRALDPAVEFENLDEVKS